MSIFGLRQSAAALLAAGLLAGSTLASAATIEGNFTLTEDITAGSANSGQVIANGTFEFDDTTTVSSYTDLVSGEVFDFTVLLSDLTITDVSVGNILGGGFSFADFQPPNGPANTPIAILSGPNTSSTVLGLFGATNPDFDPALTLSFDESNGVQGTYASVDFTARNFSSGNQAIPEPSALALLGIGLFAFGFVGRRKLFSNGI